jgi:branched-chain amino acid aminotransferase/4-amino-4-deoxychorismate lyase
MPPPPDFAPWLGAFETLRVVRGRPLFVAEHYAELLRAAKALGLEVRFDPVQALEKLPPESGRWRWIATADGVHNLFTREEPAVAGPIEIAVSPVRVGTANWDARFKTISYLTHAQARRQAATPEVVLLNEHGHVASAAGANIFWSKAGRLFTPAHEAGCRCGVMRGFVLWREKAEVGHFPLEELLDAEEIFLTNSMRGIVSVSRVEDRPTLSTGVADRMRAAYEAAIAAQL